VKPTSNPPELPHCLGCGKELKKRAQEAGGKRCRSCSNKHRAIDPEYKAKHKKAMQELASNPEWLRTRREILERQRKDPIISKRTREALLRLHQDPIWKSKQRLVLARVKSDPSYPYKQAQGYKKWLSGWRKSLTNIELKVLMALKDSGVKFEVQKRASRIFFRLLPT
jgi:hypothetical protein